MPAIPIPEAEVRAAYDAVAAALKDGYRLGQVPSAAREAAKRLGKAQHWIKHRLALARDRLGLDINQEVVPDVPVDAGGVTAETAELERLREENKRLKTELASQRRDEITRAQVWEHVTGLTQAKVEPPKWLARKGKHKGLLGVPIALWSDWHWGEVVRATEVNGANAYNLEIAHERAQRLTNTVIELLKQHIGGQYDGIVVALAGDMVSGDIHEELSKTNEQAIMPVVVDLYGVLITAITRMADEFGAVYVPCVTGNHGRNTKKIQAKERWATSFDWLVYALLAKHFASDKRVTIDAAQASEIDFRVYGHRYKLVHGDGWLGGDGQIGPAGPTIRGRKRKQARDTSMGRGFDTLCCGHWHSLMQLPTLVVNGSLKGMDEYSLGRDFDYELPAQALWLTHPEHGITIQMPVYVDAPHGNEQSPWVSVPRS